MWCYKLLYLILAHNSASKTRCFRWERNWWLIRGLKPGPLALFQAVYQLSCKAKQPPPAPPHPAASHERKRISHPPAQEYGRDVLINAFKTLHCFESGELFFPEEGFADKLLSFLTGAQAEGSLQRQKRWLIEIWTSSAPACPVEDGYGTLPASIQDSSLDQRML